MPVILSDPVLIWAVTYVQIVVLCMCVCVLMHAWITYRVLGRTLLEQETAERWEAVDSVQLLCRFDTDHTF